MYTKRLSEFDNTTRNLARKKAETALCRLCLHAYKSDDDDATGRHILFARLYYYTTKQWIAYADRSEDPELIYLIIDRFYRLYENYVLNFDKGHSTTSQHWKIHLDIINDVGRRRRQIYLIKALFLGIRAHTRFDLAEAICDAHTLYVQLHGKDPSKNLLYSMLFGRHANCMFRDASVEFATSLTPQFKHQVILKSILKFSSHLWMPAFQAARKLAWRESQRSILTGNSIRRVVGTPVGKMAL